MSTSTRRVEALWAIIDALKPTAKGSNYQYRALVYVWALEQKHSRRGWDEGDQQDVMVPWVTKKGKQGDKEKTVTFNRYYHLYRKGELESDIKMAGGEVIESGYEKDNWWAMAIKRSSSW